MSFRAARTYAGNRNDNGLFISVSKKVDVTPRHR